MKSALPDKVTWHSLTDGPEGEKPSPDDPAPQPAKPLHTDGRHSTARTTTSKRRIQRRLTPLELIQQPLQVATRKVFDLRRFLLVLGGTAIVLMIPAPLGLTPEAHRALALFVFTGMILSLQPVPLPIAALLVPVAQVALGIDTARGAFAPFADPVIYLILASLFLAETMRKHGLTRRLALYAIILSRGDFHRLIFILIALTAFLSMWVLNTATAAMLIPVAISIAQQIQDQSAAKRMLAVLVLAIGYGASIGGIGTPMGSGENAIANGQLSQVIDFSFLSWISYGFPVVLGLIPITWAMLLLVFRVPNLRMDLTPTLRELVRRRGLNNAERETIGVLVISIVLWVSGSTLEKWFGLPTTLLSSAMIAILAVALLSIEELIDWDDLKGVNWGIIFVIGAGLSLGDALDKTGASDWIVSLIEPALNGLPYLTILAILIASTFVLTQFMNSVTYGAILSPILVTLGVTTNIFPTRLMLPFVFTLALCYMLPNSSARMTLVAISGAVDTKSQLRSGLLVGLPSAIFVFAYFALLSLIGFI
ncbi:MAG TPA: DASS family sodium-coupled anion symporter [Caldilinea sp.]|nr:DASS family sodium-coupled anion symporter [Caldilinea sp.]